VPKISSKRYLCPKPPSYPIPIKLTIPKERLEIILQPLVIIILNILAKGFYKLLL
jgi:predicted transglutaminase-like protease